METVENYDNPDLELETNDNLENDIYNNFGTSENNRLLAVSKNVPLAEIEEAQNIVAQVKTDYKGNDFNIAIQQFVENFNNHQVRKDDLLLNHDGSHGIKPQAFYQALNLLNHKEKTLKH